MTTAANLNPHDQQPPRRADTHADFHDCNKLNPPDSPPLDNTFANADDDNNAMRMVVALDRVTSHTLITIDYSGGNPVIMGITSSLGNISMGIYPTSHPFHIARHGGGDANGDIDLTWDAAWPASAATMPAPIADHAVSLTGGVIDTTCTISNITNGVRVRTRSLAPAGVDRRCQVELF